MNFKYAKEFENKIININLEKLPSKTYRLSWSRYVRDVFDQDEQDYTVTEKAEEVFLMNKATIVKTVNNGRTHPQLREYLKNVLMTGENL